jgi:hypothetical protein
MEPETLNPNPFFRMNRFFSSTRRNFIKVIAGGGIVAAVNPLREFIASQSSALPYREHRKLILVLFGGGVRSMDTIDDPGHRSIPHLWNDLIPGGTLFANMRVEHLVVHPNCNASIKTGHWEYDDLDWSKPPKHPTIFEIYRKEHNAPDTAAWSFVYASILTATGESSSLEYGHRFAANVVQPPTIPRSTAEEMDRLMTKAASSGSQDAELAAAAECALLALENSIISTDGLRSEVARKWFADQYQQWRRTAGSTSHDAFLADCAINCMRQFSPGVISVDFGEIDCAHYGSWSRYQDAIRRTDELTWRLWREVETLPDYQGKTLMLILPDHGRELERRGGSGFIHHSDFYKNKGADEGCRRIWMLALGPGVPAGRIIGKPVPITAAAATGLSFLGMKASKGAAKAAFE